MLPNVPAVCIRVRTYLTMRPAECITSGRPGAERGLMFIGRDTTGLLLGDIKALWLGPEALQFYKDHRHELRAGRSVDLDVYGIAPLAGEHVGHVKTCQLAPLPPSWVKHAAKLLFAH